MTESVEASIFPTPPKRRERFAAVVPFPYRILDAIGRQSQHTGLHLLGFVVKNAAIFDRRFAVVLIGVALMCAGGALGGFVPEQNKTPPDRVIAAHTEAVHSLAFFPDGAKFVSGSRDGSAKVWELKTGRLLRTILGHDGPVFSVAVSQDGKLIATGGADHTVRIWDATTYEQTGQLEGHTGRVYGVAFLSGGRLVSGGGDGVRLWSVAQEKLLWKWRGDSDKSVVSMSLSSDQRRLALIDGYVGSAAVLDLVDRKEIARPGNRQYLIPCIAIAPDGKTVCCTQDPGATLSLFQIDGDKKITSNKEWQHLQARSMIFTPDSKRIILAGIDASVRIWDLDSRELKQEMRRASSLNIGFASPDSLAISPDGKTLLVGGGGSETPHGWENSTENIIAVYSLSDENLKPKLGAIDGSVSWEEIPCKIKTRDGQIVHYQDWRDFKHGGIISGPIMQRLADGLDAWLTPQAILYYRGGNVLEEVLNDPAAGYCDVAWDGQNAWAASLHAGVFIVDRAGKTIDRLETLPPCNLAIRIYPLASGKVLAVGVAGKTYGLESDSWMAILERAPTGGITARVFFKSADRVSDWLSGPIPPAAKNKTPSAAFQPAWFTEPPTAAGAHERCVWMAATSNGVGRCAIVNIDRLTVTAADLPRSAADPTHPIAPRNPPLWLNNHECILNEIPVFKAQLKADRSFGPDAQAVLLPFWSSYASSPLLRWNGRYLLPGERWYALDPATLHVSDLGIGLRNSQGNQIAWQSTPFISGSLGLAAFSVGPTFYRISIDPAHPLSNRGSLAAAFPVEFTAGNSVQILRRKDFITFVGSDYLLQFVMHDGSLAGNIWLPTFRRADEAEFAQCNRLRDLLGRVMHYPEERKRVGITDEQFSQLQKITAPPYQSIVSFPLPEKRKELQAMFLAYRDAPDGPEKKRAAQPLLDLVAHESDIRARQYAAFNRAVEKYLTPAQMRLLEYK